MARHFLTLYLLIVLTLAAASWGQERLWEAYAGSTYGEAMADDPAQAAVLTIVEQQLLPVVFACARARRCPEQPALQRFEELAHAIA